MNFKLNGENTKIYLEMKDCCNMSRIEGECVTLKTKVDFKAIFNSILSLATFKPISQTMFSDSKQITLSIAKLIYFAQELDVVVEGSV